MDALCVVKTGGSLYESGRLLTVLEVIARARRPVVVVPGGGPFADMVRTEQTKRGFSDEVAHRLAILAMEQMAHIITGMHRGFETADTIEDILRFTRTRSAIAVWAPAGMTATAPDIPRTWSMTSDGLAAWLAVQIGSRHVCLVKSCAVPREVTIMDLATRGIVDPEFARIVAASALAADVVGEEDYGRLAAILASQDI